MLSVNQINAQIKLTEVWKAVNDPNHPLKIEKLCHVNANCVTRAVKNQDLKEFGKSSIVQSTFLSDACKVWNNCPKNIKDCETIWSAKKAIKAYVSTLPL